jgi:hypothetical protein
MNQKQLDFIHHLRSLPIDSLACELNSAFQGELTARVIFSGIRVLIRGELIEQNITMERARNMLYNWFFYDVKN